VVVGFRMLSTYRSAKFVIHCCNEGFEGGQGLISILWQEGGGLGIGKVLHLHII
jgi:hypothetical protein